jgi:hypothetical protein
MEGCLVARTPERRGPLNASQAHEWWKDDISIARQVVDLPRPASRADVVTALHAIVDRHDALRTTLDFAADGTSEQVVHPADEQRVRIEELPGRARRESFMSEVWLLDLFDHTTDFPARFWLVIEDDLVVEVVMAFSHVVIDGRGMHVLSMEFIEILNATAERSPSGPAKPAGLQPLDIVALERQPGAQAARDAAARYWSQKLRAAPSRMFDHAGHTDIPVYSSRLTSRTAPALLAAAGTRFRTTPGTLYLAAVHVVVTMLSGHHEVLIRSHYSGRTAQSAKVVGCFHRVLFTALDLSDRPRFSEVVRRVSGETLAAQRHGVVDFFDLRTAEAQEAARRGTTFASGTTVNFNMRDGLRRLTANEQTAEPTAEPTAELWLEQTHSSKDAVGMDAYLAATLDHTQLFVEAGFNGAVLRTDDMETLMRGPEELIRLAVREPDLDFPQMIGCLKRLGGSRRVPAPVIDRCPVSLVETRTVLDRHPRVAASHVRVESLPEGSRLVAFVGARDDALSPRDLREFIMAELAPTSALVCPHHFHVFAGVPRYPNDPAAWRELPLLATGSGRDAPPRAPSGDQEEALCSAIRAYNAGAAPLNMAAGYLDAGASLAVVPAIIRRLEDMGHGGVVPDDFARPIPLSRLAALLSTR